MAFENQEQLVLSSGVLDGQVALVSGAGSGIGRAVSLRLAELGAVVFGIGRHVEPLQETAILAATKGGDFRHHVCDVRDTEHTGMLIDSIGQEHGLTMLVNNAGGQFFAPAVDITPNGWNAVVELNLNAVFNVTRAAHPYLAARGGSVVNISITGVNRGGMGMAHSIAARAGVLGLTRTLALEWASARIRVNCVGPGTVLTDAVAEEASEHSLKNLIEIGTPLQRDTSVEEVAELTAFLGSSAGELMTGQLIQIDGGAHIGAGLHMLDEAYPSR